MGALRTFSSTPKPNLYQGRPSSTTLSSLTVSAPAVRLDRCLRLSPVAISTNGIRADFLALHLGHSFSFHRRRSLVARAASHEESHVEIEVEKEKSDLDLKTEESEEAWKQTLESFKENAIKMQNLSREAYEIYSKKAMVILTEASKKLTIEAEKARRDLAVIAEELSEDSKEYLSAAADNAPESVKDIVETLASTDELKQFSEVRDFYLGIPYGLFLSVGGFFSFMLTGSISAIRFGVILGGALLALSISSLRLWKQEKSSALLLKGQAAIAAIIFLREFCLRFQRPSISTTLMTLISGAMAIFFLYRIVLNGLKKGPNAEKIPEN